MGATRLPTKLSDVCDAPVSSNFVKRLWLKYLQSPHRMSLPPRLLVVLLLSVQIMFLVGVKLVPGGSAWTTLSSFEGLVVREVSIGHPFKLLPQERQMSLRFSDSKNNSSILPEDKEPAMLSNDLLSSASTPSSSAGDDKGHAKTHTEDEHYVRDTSFVGSNAVAMATTAATTSAVAKKEQAVSEEKVFGNDSHAGEGELLVEQDKAPDKTEMHEDFMHAPLALQDKQAEREEEEHASKSQDDVRREEPVDDTGNKLAQKVNEGKAASSQCKYGYIYVYDLPAEYNHDVVANCTALNFFLNVCDTLLNGGLGKSLGEASPLGQTGSWFVSDQFTTEVVFHNRILEHPCLTQKPEEATGYYVPYYAGLDVGRYLWGGFSAERRDRVSNQLLEWLREQEAWKKKGGWGHFMTIGRITWDFRRSRDEDWGSGFFYHPTMQNMTRLLIEKNPWDYMEMAVPYPTNFHPQSDADLIAWQNHIRSLNRGNLFSFAGAPRSMFPNDFRGVLLDQCQQSQSCQSLDCSKRQCDSNEKTLGLFMNSTFCLQPRGDSFTRRSTFDCMLAGSIPVFFWHRSAYMQYKWHLPENVGSYSVFISKDEMRNGTKIEDVLNSYPAEAVQAMREAVIQIVPRIVYGVSGSSLKEHKDAFDVAIEGVMKRFHELKASTQRR